MDRIRLLSFVILASALIFICRLYFLQVVDNDIYRQKANRQYVQGASGVFNRGTIYFTAKDGSLISAATLKTGATIAVNPQTLKNPEDVYQKLNAVLPTDHDTFIAKATKANDPYEEIAKQVDEETGKKISDLNISGLSVYENRWRFYPAGTVAPRTVGFMAYQGDEYAGRYGLERFYDTTLKRNDQAYANFFAQIFSNIQQTAENKNEGDVVTSIEPSVQTFFQTELDKVNAKYSSQYTGGIIINPMTGEIYSMAVQPSFDLNNTKSVTDVTMFANPLVESTYEMGSIIKPLTVAAGIDTGVITASTTYTDHGFIKVNGKTIHNFDSKDRGVVDIQTALSQSLNVGMAFVEGQVGNDRFAQYMYGFGLNQKTNIDLPNESADLVKTLKSPRDIEYVTASFGQGISLTPIATVRALSAIANGGVLITPHVATKINYTLGVSKDLSYPAQTRAIQQSTAQEVTRMMVKNMDTALRNGTVKFPNYSVAVKTGTAQIVENGGYSATDFLHSFVGFFPAYNPKFLIFMYTVKPRGVQYSSESLTDPFIDTVRFLINYYEIPPDR